VTNDRLLANNVYCLVLIVLTTVPEIHIQHEQLDGAETPSRPARGLLDELRLDIINSAIELLEHLDTAFNIGEILSPSHERIEQKPDNGELCQFLSRCSFITEPVVDFQRSDLDADVVPHLLGPRSRISLGRVS